MADFSQAFFGKSLYELLYSDIENFFVEEKEESTRIEFKAFEPTYGDFNKGFDGVLKGICAFLNSEGGILIWGAPVGVLVEGKKEKVFKGALSPLSELKEKDWLVNKVSSSITPLPIGVNVAILQESGKFIYVFEVQMSNYAPHQFSNYYYARLDGQSRPAPHYLIEALFKKIRYPNIEGFIKVNSVDYSAGNRYLVELDVILLNFSELQNELNVSFSIMCGQGIFLNEAPYSPSLRYNNCIEVLSFGQVERVPLKLSIDRTTLKNEFDNKIDIILSFGGRYSPMKSSDYKFELVDYDPLDISIKCLEATENILYTDLQKSKGMTRESILETHVRNRSSKGPGL